MTARRAAALVGAAVLTLLAGCSSDSSTSPQAGTPAASSTPSGAAPSAQNPTQHPSGPPTLTSRVLAWHLPEPLSRSVALAQGSRVLLAGGLGPGDRSTGQVLAIDPQRGAVRPDGQLAVPLHDSAGAVLAGRPTVIGGGGASELADVQTRDPQGRWHVTGQLPGARSDLSVVRVGSRALVIGGYDGATTPTSVLATARGSRFVPVGTLPTGLRYSGVVLAHGSVWILGGEVDGHELDEVLRLDPHAGRVQRVGRMPQALGHEAVVPVGSRLLVLGGRTSPDAVTAQMWWYIPRTGAWARAGRLPYPVADAPWVVHGSRAYLFGGETPDFTDRVVRVGWHR